METPSVCVVIVTYGNREKLLKSVVSGLCEQTVSIKNLVIVSNGSSCDFEFSGLRFPVEVVCYSENKGTAVAYQAGLRKAVDLGVEFIWLLDDDNRPQKDALHVLLSFYFSLRANFKMDDIALLSRRVTPDGHDRPLRNVRNNEFLGFHLLDLVKIGNKVLGRSANLYESGLMRVDAAPYGGLFVPVCVVRKIGYPCKDFYLYEDDAEWTSRISKNGGHIFLCYKSVINELECSWWMRFRRKINYFMDPESPPASVYYGARNRVYLDKSVSDSRLMFFVNGLIRIFFIIVNGFFYSKDYLSLVQRIRIFIVAVWKGYCGHLGIDRNFSLR